LLRWLGLCCAIALLRLLDTGAQRLSVEIAQTAALAAVGSITLALALTLPDGLGHPRQRQLALIVSQFAAIGSVILAELALGPPLSWFGELWLLPACYARAAAIYSTCALSVALYLRLGRKRWGSARELLAGNTAALASLAFVWPLGIALSAGVNTSAFAGWFVRAYAALCALALCAGHQQLLGTRPHPGFAERARDALSLLVCLSLTAGLVVAYPVALPTDPLSRAAFIAGSLLVALALFAWLRRAVAIVLTPDGGRLIKVLLETRLALARSQTLPALATAVLTGLRRALGHAELKPLLYGFEPAFEVHSDAAGSAHFSERQPHPLITARLYASPRELILRSELEQQSVRKPAIRQLLEVLVQEDLLCIVPLSIDGELEGALCLPAGARRAALTLEEQTALWDFAQHLAGLLSVFSAKLRAERRAEAAQLAAQSGAAEIAQLNASIERLVAERTLLYQQRPAHTHVTPLIAYSTPARALVSQLKALAEKPWPVLFVSEPGSALLPYARLLHDKGPFIVFDCASVRADEADGALFGGALAHSHEVGCLRAAEQGTLLLLDLPALPPALQTKFAWAVCHGRALTAAADQSYPVRARILASASADLDKLAAAGRIAPELAHHLSPHVCRVPPLRECTDDIVSLVLLALDRACRRRARAPLGIEPDALAALRAYPFPGNHAELDQLIECAVQHARGPRLGLADFARTPVVPEAQAADLWSLPLEELERRALLHALTRARGDKNEAARLLGITRRSLLDKLRRHKLEEPLKSGPRPN